MYLKLINAWTFKESLNPKPNIYAAFKALKKTSLRWSKNIKVFAKFVLGIFFADKWIGVKYTYLHKNYCLCLQQKQQTMQDPMMLTSDPLANATMMSPHPLHELVVFVLSNW